MWQGVGGAGVLIRVQGVGADTLKRGNNILTIYK